MTMLDLMDDLRRNESKDRERNMAILAECRKNLIKYKIFEPKVNANKGTSK